MLIKKYPNHCPEAFQNGCEVGRLAEAVSEPYWK